MNNYEFKIGEKFKCGLVTLECIKGSGCENCFFEEYCILGVKKSNLIRGECLSENRSDKEDVVFVKVNN